MLEGGEPKKMKVFVHGLNGTGLLKEPRACVFGSLVRALWALPHVCGQFPSYTGLEKGKEAGNNLSTPVREKYSSFL